MNTRHTPTAAREAAIADFYASGDSARDVAARHGIPRSTFSGWVRGGSDDLAYSGGWEMVGGIKRPLMPSRRSA